MANGLHKYTVQEGTNLQLGQAGFDVIAESDGAVTGNWVAIYNPMDDSVPVDFTSAVGDSAIALSIPTNGIIYGNFTSIECEEGSKKIIAYRG